MNKLLLISLMTFFTAFCCSGQSGTVKEEFFLPIGGIEQWVSVKGEDASKPLILFLHGGPGSTLSPYADAIFKDWEKNFILVQWDQRGAGKTFGTYAPAELDPEFLKDHPLSVEQITEDAIAISEYLIARFQKEKIILFGTSWGSVPGARMAATRPELFHAYIGHSQVINPSENFIFVYRKLEDLAKEANDEEANQMLKSLGPPPYNSARSTGQFIRLVKIYERKNSDPAPDFWWKIAPEYNNTKDTQDRADGDDYSFINYAGDKAFGIPSMAANINLLENTTHFKIPVYLVQGEHDLLTQKEHSKDYFEKIEAPKKEFILVPGAAHGFNTAVVDSVYQVLVEKIVPEIKE